MPDTEGPMAGASGRRERQGPGVSGFRLRLENHGMAALANLAAHILRRKNSRHQQNKRETAPKWAKPPGCLLALAVRLMKAVRHIKRAHRCGGAVRWILWNSCISDAAFAASPRSR